MEREYQVPGIPDEEFFREPGVPMTKNEIRILSLARLQLFTGAVFYDIGAGCGTISIEAKLLTPGIQVYAVEHAPRALDLIEKNSAKFGADIQIVKGTAPDAIQSLPETDRIFIGGSGGRLEGIIHSCDQKLRPGGRIILNSVSLFTGPQAIQILESLGYQVEAVQVNIAQSQKKGRFWLWEARNPVVIVSGQKGQA